MKFRGDDRAQSVQVGAILLFGILIILLATIQTTVIPGQNAAVEFDHSQTVQSDMQELRTGIVEAVGTGVPQPTQIRLGTRYPNRLLFINPPPPSGRIRTVDEVDATMTISLENGSGALPVNSRYENARKYWASRNLSYNTTKVVYTPDYTEYDNPPDTVYGNSVVYNAFENGYTPTLTDQNLVQGDTLNLFALRGSLSETRAGSYTANVRSISQTARTVTVDTSDGPVYLNITSRLSKSTWNSEALLGNESNASVTASVPIGDTGYNRTTVELTQSYQLRAGAVGVGSLEAGEERAGGAYLVVVERGSSTVTVEVRDQFNNPVIGENVSSDLAGAGTRLTNEDGQVTYDDVPSSGVDAWLTGSGRSEWEEISATPSDSTSPTPTNGTDTYQVEWTTGSGLPDGVSYSDGRFEVNRSEVGTSVDLNGTVTVDGDTIPGMPVTLATNGSANTSFQSNSTNTDGSGKFSGTLEVPENGTSRIFASSGDGVGAETVYIYGEVQGPAPGLPEGSVAFDDTDGDGAYDDGETTYSASDFGSADFQGTDLVIARDVSRQGGYDVQADSVTIVEGVTVTTNDYGITRFQATNGDLLVKGTIDATQTSNEDITLEGTSVDVREGTVRTGGDITITATSGALLASDSEIDGTSGSGGTMTLEGLSVDIRRATLLSDGSMSITATSETLRADNSLLDVSEGSNAGLTLTTGNELYLTNAKLIGDQYSSFTGNRESKGRTVFVDGAIFERGDNGDQKDFDVDPGDRTGNGKNPPQNVQGTPQKGTVV